MNATDKTVNVFLASSFELELERVHIGDLFNDVNSLLIDTDIRLRLLKWENFDPSYTGERSQSLYDRKVEESDIFIVLFRIKKGKYTIEEVKTALDAHTQNKKPRELYCFIQDTEEKRDFDISELKTELTPAFTFDTFSDIPDLKRKAMRILSPRLKALGAPITETEKFVRIGSVNLLRKT